MSVASGSRAGTGIPVFVMLPLGILDDLNQVNYEATDPNRTGTQYVQWETPEEKALLADLVYLRQNVKVTGVMVDCWWGRVEAAGPGKYNWDGYKNLFSIVKAADLELHVVMSFHACVENGVETIPLPGWVKRIGEEKDLFYKDAHDNPSTEYLSWAVDKKPVLKDQLGHRVSPLQVYKNFMSEFRNNMSEYLSGTITMIEVGLGPCGELRYPAYRSGWKPGPPAGIGEFQCYDQYMRKRWEDEAEEQGFTIPCCVGPQTAGDYTSTPKETQFFQTGGGLTDAICYSDTYGKTFLNWYSKNLVDHGQRVLQSAKEIFMSNVVNIAAKVPGVYWYCNDPSRAAEATAGLINGGPDRLSVYELIAGNLQEMGATFIFTCVEKKNDPDNETDIPQQLVEQVLGAARSKRASIACENGSDFDDRDTYNRIIDVALRYNISYFTYMRLLPKLMTARFGLFQEFVGGMNARTLI